jgi:hypothetical protein
VIGILGVMAHSVRVDKPELNKIVAVLVLLRAYMPLFDIEDRRQRQSQLFNSIFLVNISKTNFWGSNEYTTLFEFM